MLNREAIEEFCEDELIARIRANEPLPRVLARKILRALSERRLHRALESVAEAVINVGWNDPEFQLFYARALVLQGKLTPALQVLKPLQQGSSQSEGERMEVLELVGEACKRLYVERSAPLLPASRQNVLRAIRAYSDAYNLDRRVLWYGINVVALVHRAGKDGIRIPEDIVADLLRSGDVTPVEVGMRKLARAILTEVQERMDTGDAAFRDFAVAAQASLALDAPSDVDTWLASCVNETVDSFDLAELLRQLTDVWQLDSSSEAGRRTLPLLRAALLKQEGGALSLSIGDANQDCKFLEGADRAFRNFIGSESVGMLGWYVAGLVRSWSIVQIDTLDGRPPAAGVLVNGTELGSVWGGLPAS
jgi:hypothetical protein